MLTQMLFVYFCERGLALISPPPNFDAYIQLLLVYSRKSRALAIIVSLFDSEIEYSNAR